MCHSWMGLCSGHENYVVIRELSLYPQSLLAKLTVLEKCTQALQVGLDARLYQTLLTDQKRQDLHASSGYDVRKYPGLSVSIAK